MVVSNSVSVIGVVGQIPWSTHFGLFYRTKQDLIDVLVPYFKAGLENNQYCMWVTAEPLGVDEARALMARAMPDFDMYVEKGQIEIIPYTDWYMIDDAFDADRVLKGWVDKLRKALEMGYAGLRLTGNESWLDSSLWHDFIDYEQSVNDVVGQYKMIILCSYPQDKGDASDVLDVAATHQFVLSKRNGEWKLIEDQGNKKSRKELQESEERFRDIVETADEGIWVLNKKNQIIFLNSRIARMLGYSPEELMGRFAYEFVDKHYTEIAKFTYNNRRKGLKGNTDVKFRRKDGSEMWARISSSPRFKDNAFDGVLEMVTDITDDRRAALMTAWLASFPRLDPEPIIEMRPFGQISYSNPAADGLFPDLRAANIDHPYLAGLETIYARLQREGSTVAPREVWVGTDCYEQSISYYAETDSLRIYGRNITRRKLSEEALRRSEAELARAQLISHIGSWTWDIITNELAWSDESYRNYGLVPGVVKPSYELFLSFIVPEDRERVDLEVQRAIKGGHNYRVTYNIIRKDGALRTLLSENEVVFDRSGKVILMFGTNQDITERKAAEEALRETRNFLESLINYANAPIIVWDPAFTITQFNHAFERLSGYGSGEVVGKNLKTLFPPGNIDGSLAKIRSTLTGEHWESVEIPILRKDGSIRIALWNSANIYGEMGELRATIAQGQDITDRKRAEDELAKAKDTAELYLDLMGHDINNYNQVALGYLELLNDLVRGGELKTLAAKPMEAISSSSRLIENVRKLQKARTGEFQVQAVDLDKVLSELQAQYSEDTGKIIKIRYSRDEDCIVMANGLIKDVFANLISNAIKHTNGKSPTEVAVLLVKTVEDGKKYCRVAVEDNGPGIPDAVKSKLFHRFQRGDTQARGKGLGLYLARSLVESYGGRVWVEDRVTDDPKKGARFVVMLPLCE